MTAQGGRQVGQQSVSLFLALCIVGGDEAAPVVLELLAGPAGGQVQWVQPDFRSGHLGQLGFVLWRNLIRLAVLEEPESLLGLRLSRHFYV